MKLRVGTRRSRLALAQAEEVAGALAAHGIETELVPMTTSGDRGASSAGSPAGMKGLFVAEIVRALQDDEVDVAVHSAKDLPSDDPEGVVVVAVPERADPHDYLVTRDRELPEGAVIGTSSLRRRAQLLLGEEFREPRARIVDLRGNVDTRLRKLAEGEVDAVVLAGAGMRRLGIWPATARPLPILPAPGQGCLAVQARAADAGLPAVAALDDPASRDAFEAERAVMRALGGGCALPLGAFAERRKDGVALVALVASPDGSRSATAEAVRPTAEEAADAVVRGLREGGADEILREVRA